MWVNFGVDGDSGARRVGPIFFTQRTGVISQGGFLQLYSISVIISAFHDSLPKMTILKCQGSKYRPDDSLDSGEIGSRAW